jgi:ribose/xylose/arabinose/galactoside ABC-type transport system permease subunit
MSPAVIFQLQLVLGYVPWLLVSGAYFLPKLRSMEPAAAQRAIAMLHSFRFFGLVFILPGVVGPNLPAGFASLAAYGDFATGVLAMLAVLSFRFRPLFWTLVMLFNALGVADIVTDYIHGVQFGLPELAGQLGAAYLIPIIYVPLLTITHFAAFGLLLGRRSVAAQRNPLAAPVAE